MHHGWISFVLSLLMLVVLIETGVMLFRAFTRRPREQVVAAKGKETVTFEAKVWRGKGGLYPDYTDPNTGEMIPWPGGEWRQDGQGRWLEGRWWDKGIIATRENKPRRWLWLWLKVRMELQGIKLFLLAMIKRRL